MRILGISSNFHDSSAALVIDGRLVVSVAEERLTYQKHDPTFPSLAARACLKHCGLSVADIDLVAYHEDPVVKFTRVLASSMNGYPRNFGSFASTMQDLILGQFWVKYEVFRELGILPEKIRYVPHHLSHAAAAFLLSPFEDAAVLTLDAVGEWTSTSSFRASRRDGKLSIEPVDIIPYPHSLGLLYSAVTGFLGFRVNDGECSTMALAAFGMPVYAEEVRKIVRVQSDGTYELDLDYFDLSAKDRPPVSRKFLQAFGEPRDTKRPLPFECRMDRSETRAAGREAVRYADLAASVQLVLEEAVFALTARLRERTGAENLCLSGGVALNSTLNGKLLRDGPFAELFVPSDPGDGGGAAGAALFAHAVESGRVEREPACSDPLLGLAYGADLDFLSRLKVPEWSRYRSSPTSLPSPRRLETRRFAEQEFDGLVDEVSRDLSKGKIVGWVQGRFESGPRALGNRSLLIDPGNREAAERLSRTTKLRAPFRPYALSVPEASASRLFEFGNAIPAAMRWMSSTHPVSESARAQVSEAIHVDGSTRPQVLSSSENPRYHRLLEAWQSRSGAPGLLNTSFNESGLPMVSSPVDALLMFARTDIETLVLGNTLIRKES